MTDEQDLRERLEHLELDGNQVANVLAIIAQAIADATAEQGECYYQLEIHGDDGWEVLSNPVTDKDLTGDQKKLSAWFDGVKVYHKHQGMRLVKVTKQVLHERAALEAALNT
jgi:hypothetical protein